MEQKGAQGSEFRPSHVIVLSELSPEERDLYYEMMVQFDIRPVKDRRGRNVANMRILAPGIKKVDTKSTQKTKKSKQTPLKRRARLASMSQEEIMEALTPVTINGVEFDCALYPRFAAAVGETTLKPKLRPLTWVMKLMEEMYDSRYAQDMTELQKEPELEEQREPVLFPLFVIDHLSKRYGLQSLVEQNSWDFLWSIHNLRTSHLEIEIFSRFLQEVYDSDDLLFYLYLRSVIQKMLNVSFKARWSSESSRSVDRSPKELWLTYKECTTLARAVFGSEDESMQQDFLRNINSQVVGQQKRQPSGHIVDTRRIEVTQLLHLAVGGYHEARPADPESTQLGIVESDGPNESVDEISTHVLAMARESNQPLDYDTLVDVAQQYFDMSGQSSSISVHDIASQALHNLSAKPLEKEQSLEVDSALHELAHQRKTLSDYLNDVEDSTLASPTSNERDEAEDVFVHNLVQSHELSELVESSKADLIDHLKSRVHELVSDKLRLLGDISGLNSEEKLITYNTILSSQDIQSEMTALASLLVEHTK